jgi:endonuclease G
MAIDPKELGRARLALQQAVGRNLFDDVRKINMVDIAVYDGSARASNPLAIRYHVDEFIDRNDLEAMDRISLEDETILGVPSMIVKGTYRPQQFFGAPRPSGATVQSGSPFGRSNPLRGGVSISTPYAGTGTLGGIVRDRATGRPMLLSNWHVLVTYWGAPRGQSILQPSRNDGGRMAEIIAGLERDAMSMNLDAAVAYLNDRRQPSNRQLDGRLVTRAGRATLGMDVEKSGRSSGKTYGRVTGIEGVVRLRYNWVERMIGHVVTIEPRGGEVSRPGDSGSWWLNSTTGEAIGLHFAGGNYPERGLALDMGTVLNALNVDMWS